MMTTATIAILILIAITAGAFTAGAAFGAKEADIHWEEFLSEQERKENRRSNR